MNREPKTRLEKIMQYSERHNVEVYESMPPGYSVIPGASTAPLGSVWISNGKSRFDHERRVALLLELLVPDEKKEGL